MGSAYIHFFPVAKADALRRRQIISKLGSFIEEEKTALDVGCGSGVLSAEISTMFGMKVVGIDLREPEDKLIGFTLFDGETIPFETNSFDVVFLFDVLHHVKGKQARERLLSECFRVAKSSVIIKDHWYSNFFQKQYLKLVDFLTNFFVFVPTPFEFVEKKEWEQLDCLKINYWTSWGIPHVMLKIKKDHGK